MGELNEDLKLNTGTIILAAGLGQRLKAVGLKPFLLYNGKSFIEIVVERALSIGLDPLVIVTNPLFYPQIVAYNFPAKILINHHPEQGMLSSIWIGLDEIESACDGFFLCQIDYPLVQPDTFQRLLSARQSFPDRIIKPIFNSKSGHPIIFPRNMFPALRQAPLNLGARFVTRRYQQLTSAVEVTDPGILVNINTPEAYHRYCR